MRSFCTYFDENYLTRGLALYESLQRHAGHFELWVLCMDDASFTALEQLGLPGIRAVPLSDFERDDEPLRAAKGSRSKIEYYFTCTSSLPLYVFGRHPEVQLITYLDADLFFFADPEPVFEEIGDASVALTPHRFPPALRDRERYGIYNVGWISFRRDKTGVECLTWWRDRCIEWCHDREEGGRFADQKYLDDWPARFPNVVVLAQKGANLAPWNVGNYRLRPSASGGVTVDGDPLIFFHFHALKRISRWTYDPGWIEYGVPPSSLLRSRVYVPYLRTLFSISRGLLGSRNGPAVSNSSRHWSDIPGERSPVRRLVERLRRLKRTIRDIAAGRMLFLPGA